LGKKQIFPTGDSATSSETEVDGSLPVNLKCMIAPDGMASNTIANSVGGPGML